MRQEIEIQDPNTQFIEFWSAMALHRAHHVNVTQNKNLDKII